MDYLRKCIKCGLEAHTEEDLKQFEPHKNCVFGRTNTCKKCKAEYRRRWAKGWRSGPNYQRSKQRRQGQGIKDKRQYRIRKKLEFLKLYGGKCSCCGEQRFEFLTLDHVLGKTPEERKKRFNSGYIAYVKAIKLFKSNPEKALKTYRILCWNCNCAIGSYGYCPHEGEKRDSLLSSADKATAVA